MADDPQLYREYLRYIAESAPLAGAQTNPPFFVRWGFIPGIIGEHYALKSQKHHPDDFVMTCGSRAFLEESAQFMNANLPDFPPTEDSVVLHDTLVAAIEARRFVPKTIFPG